MSRTIRVFWPNQTSGWLNFNWTNVINNLSVVTISVSEGTLFRDPARNPLNEIHRIRRSAVMSVKNIRPHFEGGGGVEFFVEINSPRPVNIVTDITVHDRPIRGHIIR